MTEYKVASSPQGISAATDGAVWFAEQLSGGETQEHIGRIGVDGEYSEVPLPASGQGAQCGWQCPWDTALGTDGAIWVTEGLGQGGVGVGRVRPDGAYAQHSVNFGLPYAIVSGPDGALWFTNDGSGKLGRISVDGVMTSTIIDASPGTALSRIASGTDSALWVTYSIGPDLQNRTGHLARVTTAGLVQHWDLPGGVVGSGIRSNSDGSVWIAAGARIVAYRP
jgi:virginiamycin B lyase